MTTQLLAVDPQPLSLTEADRQQIPCPTLTIFLDTSKLISTDTQFSILIKNRYDSNVRNCIVLYIICISFMIDKDCTSHLTMMTRLLKSGSCLMGSCFLCLHWFSIPELFVTLPVFPCFPVEPEQNNTTSYLHMILSILLPTVDSKYQYDDLK